VLLRIWCCDRGNRHDQSTGKTAELGEDTVADSHCDRFAEAHFRHAGNNGYIFEGDLEVFNELFGQYGRGEVESLDGEEN
jgi:hypothetical protein